MSSENENNVSLDCFVLLYFFLISALGLVHLFMENVLLHEQVLLMKEIRRRLSVTYGGIEGEKTNCFCS